MSISLVNVIYVYLSKYKYFSYLQEYLRISNPCVMSPDGVAPNMYSCSFAANFRIHPVIPSVTGRRFANPVILPVPPRNTGSRNVMREKRPCNRQQKSRERKRKRKIEFHNNTTNEITS